MEPGRTILGWAIDRVIANDGKLHEYAVSKDGVNAVMHVVAKGESKTLLYDVTGACLLRGTDDDGNAFVITTDAQPVAKRRSPTTLVVGLAMMLVAGAGLGVYSLTRSKPKAAAVCADCVMKVGDVEVSSAAFRMYVGDPYLLEGKKADDRKRAALSLLIARAALYAEAQRLGLQVSDVEIDEQAKKGQYVIGARRFDLHAKLVETGETFDDGTRDRYAKSLGFDTWTQFLAELRIEYLALAAREKLTATDAELCASMAKSVVVVTKLVDAYVPCK